MEKIKTYLKYVNQWNVMFYVLVFLQLVLGWEGDHYDWYNVWGAALVWALFMLGYNSLDRELDIMLQKAKAEMAKDA